MKKLTRLTALLVGLMLCISLLSVGAFATSTLDWEDAYVAAYDENGELFESVYPVGTVFNYHLALYVWDTELEEYVEQDILNTDVVTVYDTTDEYTVLATGTGSVISWQPAGEGVCQIEIELTRGEQSFYGSEIYQIGDNYDLEWAELIFDGGFVSDELIYDGKSFLDRFDVYYYPTDSLLVEGEDYEIEMTDPIGPGMSTITVTGVGTNVGELEYEVEIISPSAVFDDVDQDAWYVGSINKALLAGLFVGTSDTEFAPDGTMSRAMFVTVIGRLMGFDETDAPEHFFTDVEEGEYYAPHVAWAAAIGIVAGTSETTFSPDEDITREQMCAFIHRFNDFISAILSLEMDIDIAFDTEATELFADDRKISDWAKDAVYGCRNGNIVQGKLNNRFDPQGNATRAEAATVLVNYIYYIAENIMLDLVA